MEKQKLKRGCGSPALVESIIRPPLPPLKSSGVERPRTSCSGKRKAVQRKNITSMSPIVVSSRRPHTSHLSIRKGNSQTGTFLTDIFAYESALSDTNHHTESRVADNEDMRNRSDANSDSNSENSNLSDRGSLKDGSNRSEISSDDSMKSRNRKHSRSTCSDSESSSECSDSSNSNGSSTGSSEREGEQHVRNVVRRIPGDQKFKFFASGYSDGEDGYSSSEGSSSEDSEIIVSKLGLSITRDFTEQVLTHREQISNTGDAEDSSDGGSDECHNEDSEDSSNYSDNEDNEKELESGSESGGTSEETEDTEEGELEHEDCTMKSSLKAWKTPRRNKDFSMRSQQGIREKLIVPKLPMSERVVVEDISAQDLQYLEAFTTPRSSRHLQDKSIAEDSTKRNIPHKKTHVPPHIRLSQKEESLHTTLNNGIEKKLHSHLPKFDLSKKCCIENMKNVDGDNFEFDESHTDKLLVNKIFTNGKSEPLPMAQVRIKAKLDSKQLDKTFNFRDIQPNAIGSPEFQQRIVRAAEAAAEEAEREGSFGTKKYEAEVKNRKYTDEKSFLKVASREHMTQMLSALHERRLFLQSVEDNKVSRNGSKASRIAKAEILSSMAPSPSAVVSKSSASLVAENKVSLNIQNLEGVKDNGTARHNAKISKEAFFQSKAKDGYGVAKPILVSRKNSKFKRNVYTSSQKQKSPAKKNSVQVVGRNSRANSSKASDGKTSYGGRRLEYLRLLGRGASAKVYLGKLHHNTGVSSKVELVAVKQLRTTNKDSSESEEIGRVLRLEVDTLRRLNHRNIVSYRGMHFSKRRKEYQILMEYVDGGSLADAVKKFPNGIAHEELVRIATQIVDGLVYLHEQKVIHRDLKPANILFSKKGVVKIADFDISTQVHGLIKTKQRSCVGTPWYTAPEVILVEPYSYSADIWSLGCTMFQLATGKCPYSECNAVQAMFKMVNCGCPRFPKEFNLHEDLKDFIFQCFRRDPKKRPSARELREHQFLCGKWAKLGCSYGTDGGIQSDEEHYSSDFDVEEEAYIASHK